MPDQSADMKLVVKRTFLEFVDDDVKTVGMRSRGFTDSACLAQPSLPSSTSSTAQPSSPPLSNILEEEEDPASVPLSAGCDENFYSTPMWEVQREPVPQLAGYPPHFELPSGADPHAFMMMPPVCMDPIASQYGCWSPASNFHKPFVYEPSLDATYTPTAGSDQITHHLSGDCASNRFDMCRTTVMLRQLPKHFTRDMLIEFIDNMGFAGKYDFVYLPVDFSSGVGLGYAFVNLNSESDVKQFWTCFEGFAGWESSDNAPCTVSWSDPHQGLAVHVERYRNSPVMHSTVPESWKPALFVNGVKAVFPFPTKKIKAPKLKHRLQQPLVA